MAIQYKSNDPAVTQTLVIGGEDDVLSGDKYGGVGPFPTYSINREDMFAEDGTYLNSKYNITITGFATIKKSDDSSATNIKGKRQSRIQGEKIIKLQFNRNKFPMLGNGVLEINAYGTNTNKIKFNDAKLLSIDIPEDTEESAGIHYSNYTFTFEAYNLDDYNMPTDMVSSIEESWDLSQNDGEFCFSMNDFSKQPYKIFTLTHTISATGLRKYNGNSLESGEGDAWRQAEEWVKSRLVDSPSEVAISAHINNKIGGPKFTPFYMNSEAKKLDLKIDLTRDGKKYKAYNHTRDSNVSISGATYSVTETWKLALEDTLATHTISVNIDSSQDSSSISVTVAGSINGLNSATYNTNINNSYDNAKIEYNKLISSNYIFTEAKRAYTNMPSVVGGVDALRDVKQKRSVGHNKITGTITWSETYNNEKIIGDSNIIASESISLSYNNDRGNIKNIAIIPVLGRPKGPIIHFFDSRKVKTVSMTIDLIMKKDNRDLGQARTAARNIVDKYRNGQKISARTEQWNKETGTYNLSIEWVYI